MFIRELGNKFNTGKVGVTAENKEKYISSTVDVIVDWYEDASSGDREVKEKKIQLRFIDSIRFMASSLVLLSMKLVGVSEMVCNECGGSCEVTDVNEDYVAHGKCSNCYTGYSKRQLTVDSIFDNRRDNRTDEQFKLLLRKGVYPHGYMSNWDKFKETKLPPKEGFYSNLNMSDISKYDYENVQKVWKEFNIKNLGEHNKYLKTDVLLLSNVYEAIRNTCLEHHKLDLVHFYTSPGLAWHACLKKTGIRSELLTDPDMLLMFERGIRGGIIQAVHRYAKANNKYMGKPEGESSFLQGTICMVGL